MRKKRGNTNNYGTDARRGDMPSKTEHNNKEDDVVL